MKGLSLFSGIGGFDLAMERAGIELVGMCEIDKNAQNVLRKRFPNVELYDDVRKVGKDTHERGSVDVICGGFPCQDLSIAGKRAGLAGERSGLWFEFARIIDELEPGWVIIENVPGLLSSDKGRDLAVILRWLVERGYGVSWRILDAQYFGVPQRRRRVFIVASFGNGRSAKVLFESTSLPRNPAESRETGKTTTGTFTVRSGKDGGGKGYLGQESLAMTLGGQPQWAYNIHTNDDNRKDRPNGGFYVNDAEKSPTLQTGQSKSQTLVATFIKQRIDEYKTDTVASTVSARDYKSATDIIWQNRQQSGEVRIQDDTMPTMTKSWGTGGNNVPFVGVRRLTPTECERLQGFPDVKKSVIINICLDHQKTYANAESKNPKLQKRAGTVEKKDLLETAKYAENNLSTKDQQTSEPVDVHVHINLERQILQIHSHGKLLLSVNIAERKNSSLLRIPVEDFVHLVALTLTTWGKTTHNGKGVSRQNTMHSTIQLNGSNVATLFGEETDALAADAEKFIKMVNFCLTYTTSEAAQSSLNLEQISTISSYCVLIAIISSIPGLTNPTSSYNLKLTINGGWTASQSDTQRYKQLGNAVAVPVVQWIIDRIVTITK